MRKKILALGVVVGVLAALGIAFAAWTATGTGNGYAKAKTAVDLSTVAVTPAATLYPGATGNALISIVNPNDYQIQVTDITGNGAIVTSSPNVPACDASTGVTFTNQTGQTLNVPAHSAGTLFTLTGAVSMDNSSVDACQGATFTIPVSLAGVSNP
jgi:hypothetical protein